VSAAQPSGHRSLDGAIWRLAIPAFGALVAHPLFLLTDAAIVATLGTTPLAGLGAATTIVATLVGLAIFLAYATTASVARRLGAGDRAGALDQGIDGMVLGLGLGVVLAIIMWFGAQPLVIALGTSPEATDQAVIYLRIVAVSMPAMLGVLAGVGVLRGLQDTKTTLYVTIAQVGLNLLLSVLLVLVLGFGIAGSAIGTAVAEVVGLIAYGFVIVRLARREGSRLRPSGAGVLRSVRDGVPLFIRTIALRVVFLVAAAVAARLGDDTLAAWHVTSTLFFTLALSLDALAIAGQALLGRTLGAGDVEASRYVTRRLVLWSTLLGVGLTVFVLVIRPWLPGWFSEDAAVIALISSALIIVAIQQPLAGVTFALDGVLIGAGDMRFLAIAQTVVMVLFLPAAWVVFNLGLGLDGLWWAMAWFLLIRAIILGWRARGSAWLVTGLTR
jgi:putative MATE family efflux protein